jgi:cytoskeletal protein CcmA (bactofilin family)
MFGDDPDPRVAADGSFTWEATRGYGFVKLRFDGRIVGDVVRGRLMVEDRSVIRGSDRFEFDYCFAGDDFELKR